MTNEEYARSCKTIAELSAEAEALHKASVVYANAINVARIVVNAEIARALDA